MTNFYQNLDISTTLKWAEETIALSTEQGFSLWRAGGLIFRGWALAMQGESEEGLAQMEEGRRQWQRTGSELLESHHAALLAQAYGAAGQIERGLLAVDEGLRIVARTEERAWEAELYHIQRELLLLVDSDSAPRTPEVSFQRSLEVARRQQAKLFELRASVSLARLWRDQGKLEVARELLTPIYDWFTEGLDTADLQEAQALLFELREERA